MTFRHTQAHLAAPGSDHGANTHKPPEAVRPGCIFGQSQNGGALFKTWHSSSCPVSGIPKGSLVLVSIVLVGMVHRVLCATSTMAD